LGCFRAALEARERLLERGDPLVGEVLGSLAALLKQVSFY
jgi:hypothetical protein